MAVQAWHFRMEFCGDDSRIWALTYYANLVLGLDPQTGYRKENLNVRLMYPRRYLRAFTQRYPRFNVKVNTLGREDFDSEPLSGEWSFPQAHEAMQRHPNQPYTIAQQENRNWDGGKTSLKMRTCGEAFLDVLKDWPWDVKIEGAISWVEFKKQYSFKDKIYRAPPPHHHQRFVHH